MRNWILAAVVLLALIAAGALYLVSRLGSYVSENRERIAGQIGSALSRKVAFDDFGVSALGGLSVRVDGLRIADDARFGAGDFIRAEKVYVRVHLLPALFGRYEIATVELDAPEIAIYRTADGFNFDSLGGRKPTRPGATAVAASPAPDETAAAVLLVSKLRVRGGRIHYVDRRTNPPAELAVEKLDLSASEIGTRRLSKLSLSASLFGADAKNVSVTGSLGPLLAGTEPRHLRFDLGIELGPIGLVDLASWKPAAAALPPELSSPDRVHASGRVKGTAELVGIDASLDATDAVVRYGDALDKPAGVPLSASFHATRSASEIEIASAKLRLASLAASAKGRVATGSQTTIDVEVEIPPAQLAGWERLVPKLGGVAPRGEAEGRVRMSGRIGEKRVPLLNGSLALRDAGIDAGPRTPRIDGLTTTIAFEGESANLPSTTVSLDGSPVTVRGIGHLGQPVFELDVEAPELHPGAIGLTARDDSERLREVRAHAEIRPAVPEARLALRSESGLLQGVAYRGLRAEVASREGAITLSDAELRAFEGTVAASGRYERAAGAFELRASAHGVSMGALLASRRPKPKADLEGRLQGDLALAGVGADWAAIRASLRGNGTLAVENGVLKEINVAEGVMSGLTGVAGLSQLASQRLRSKYPQLFGADDTRFEELGGSVTIAAGRMSTDDLALRTADYTVRAAGWIDFEQRVDLDCRFLASERLTADIVSDAKEVRYLTRDSNRLEIPFRLRGQLPKAHPEPDAKRIGKMLSRGLVEKGLGGLIGGSRREPGSPDGGGEDLLQRGFRKLFGGKKRDR